MHVTSGTWRWGLSIRACLAVGVPFSLGVLLDLSSTFMWMTLGAMMMANTEPVGPYRIKFRQIVMIAPVAASGYFLGYLTALPWGAVVAIMTLVGFLASILSSYNMQLSIGSMLALLVGSVAIGLPEIGTFWLCSVMFLVGAAYYAVLLFIQFLFFPQRPWRVMQAELLQALSTLAQTKANGKETDNARRVVTAKIDLFHDAVCMLRVRSDGRSGFADIAAAQLHSFGTILGLILDVDDPAVLADTAKKLSSMKEAVLTNQTILKQKPAPATSFMHDGLNTLADALNSQKFSWKDLKLFSFSPVSISKWSLRIRLDSLIPGSNNLYTACSVALCTGLAYAMHWVDHVSHWFWIPLTVSLLMKPDLGSIFARSVQRCIGTAIGVLIGMVILSVLPKGMILALLIAFIAALLPWAKQVSYFFQSLVLTPLVLILIDMVSPGLGNVDYADLRLLDTIIAAVITIIFGYLIWPKRNDRQVSEDIRQGYLKIAAYLRMVMVADSDSEKVGDARRQAYGALANIRLRLQKMYGDPPPVSRNAAAWFPVVASAERICDYVTAYSVEREDHSTQDAQVLLEDLAQEIENFQQDSAAGKAVINPQSDQAGEKNATNELVSKVVTELNNTRSLIDEQSFRPKAIVGSKILQATA